MSDLVRRATEFATRRHALTRYGGEPYEVHLSAVAQVLITHEHDAPIWEAAAWLHDTIEDTGTTRGELENQFGRWVADRVWAVTGVGPNRRARNRSIYEKLALDPEARILKIADRIANLSSPTLSPGHASMYLKEREEFHAAVMAAPVAVPLELAEELGLAYKRLQEQVT